MNQETQEMVELVQQIRGNIMSRPEHSLWVKNKKNGKIYLVIDRDVVNATNSQDGQRMILYIDENGDYYVREFEEFYNKFVIIEREK